MSNDIYIDQVLDDYLAGRVTLTETEKLLADESVGEPGEEIALHHAAVAVLQRDAVLVQVKNIHTRFLKERHAATVIEMPVAEKNISKPAPVKPMKWLLRIAAVLVLAVGGWYGYQYSNTSSDDLYAEIYQSYNVNTDRGFAEIVPHNMIEEYKAKDYNAVIATYNTLAVSNSREKFLTAMAYHETGNYQQSVDLLAQIIDYNNKNNSRFYADEADFFTGLNYLKMKKGKQAFPWFEKIYNNPVHTFHERVSKWMMTRMKWLK